MPQGITYQEFKRRVAAIPEGERFREMMIDDDPSLRTVVNFRHGRVTPITSGLGGELEFLKSICCEGHGMAAFGIWNNWRYHTEKFNEMEAFDGRFRSILMPNPEWLARWNLLDLADVEKGEDECR